MRAAGAGSEPGAPRIAGLIEGPLPPAADALDQVQAWCQATRSTCGVTFRPAQTAGRMSLLPDEWPARAVGPDLPDLLTSALERLVAIYPPPLRARLTSTVQSQVQRGDTVLESLYRVTVTGIARHDRERALPRPLRTASTTHASSDGFPDADAARARPVDPFDHYAPERAATRRRAWRRYLLAALLLGGALIATLILVDMQDVRARFGFIGPANVTAGALAPYLEPHFGEAAPTRPSTVLLHVHALGALPADAGGIAALLSDPRLTANPAATQALHSLLGVGIVWGDWLDAGGQSLGVFPIDLRTLVDERRATTRIARPALGVTLRLAR